MSSIYQLNVGQSCRSDHCCRIVAHKWAMPIQDHSRFLAINCITRGAHVWGSLQALALTSRHPARCMQCVLRALLKSQLGA